MSDPRLVSVDPDLGPVRYCGRCDDWWPMDSEFWSIQIRRAGMTNSSHGQRYTLRTPVVTYTCRGCRRERDAAAHRQRRATA